MLVRTCFGAAQRCPWVRAPVDLDHLCCEFLPLLDNSISRPSPPPPLTNEYRRPSYEHVHEAEISETIQSTKNHLMKGTMDELRCVRRAEELLRLSSQAMIDVYLLPPACAKRTTLKLSDHF